MELTFRAFVTNNAKVGLKNSLVIGAYLQECNLHVYKKTQHFAISRITSSLKPTFQHVWYQIEGDLA
jgi:hypothetical protein